MSRATSSVDARRALFRKAHADGLEAIRHRDFRALVNAVRRENELIAEQAKAIEAAKQARAFAVAGPPAGRRRKNRTDQGGS